MLRTAASKVAWVGRTASMVFGLALILALIFGVATMAFAANGSNLLLGILTNTATKVTGLVGNVDGAAALRVTNPNPGTNDTALDLRVQAGEAPMRVNSPTKVANLNADKLDGKDFSAFGAQEVFGFLGRLPQEKTFTSKGGTLIILASGSGFRGTGTSLKEGYIGMDIRLDGSLVGSADVYTNERNSHKAFASAYAVVPDVSAGEHSIRLEERYSSLCNTEQETQFMSCTDTDLNDRFQLAVIEMPAD